MNQRGVNVNTPLLIDSLVYTYFTNSNQLEKVKDLSGNTVNLGDFTDTTLTGDDYAYDANGNQLKDNNKHIHTGGGGNGTTYNFLDKPDSIHVNGKGSIIYSYDAAGEVLQKTITDTKLNTKTVITYVAGFVYQKILPSSGNASTVPDTLQYTLHEEGRIRPIASGFAYDYFLKDHLGNIRSVITDEQDTDAYPVASLESATINNEKIYYSGLDNGVIDKSTVTNYPTTDTYTSPNDKIQQLRGDGLKIGAGILLKVMAGDTINVHVASWWKAMGLTPDDPVSPLTDIVNALTNSLPGVSGNKYIASQLGTVLNPSISSFLSSRDATYNNAHPSSWLNIVVLDEQLNPVITNDGNNSYYEQVGNASTPNVKQYNQSRVITKSGYVYVYVSNECPNIYTYWDDLQVTHVKGHLLQENSYYPFGLEMKALSSMAAPLSTSGEGSGVRYKFNAGTNLESDFDVDYYETPARNYDPQIGRFTGIDAMSEQTISLSTYQFASNDPVLMNDPTGLLSNADWNDFLNRLDQQLSGEGGGFGENGGYYGSSGADGGFTAFSSQDEAFGYGSEEMSQNGWWGTNPGWATSPGDALNRYDASQHYAPGTITKGMVQGLMNSYLAPRNPDYISPVHEISASDPRGHGFTVGYSLAADDVGYSFYMSDTKVQSLLTSFYANPWNAGVDLNDPESETPYYLEKTAGVVSIGADAFSITTHSIGVADKTLVPALEGLSRSGTVVGAIAGAAPAIYHAFNGDWEWGRDGTAVLLGALGIFAEISGWGEVWDTSIAAGTLVYDTYEIAH